MYVITCTKKMMRMKRMVTRMKKMKTKMKMKMMVMKRRRKSEGTIVKKWNYINNVISEVWR